ncbi:hypothetical protein [Paraburkholderia sartisoli]|uniref:Uncharacterized protein n=1 Tax=Paraburkholderia sartisoli TaxID=83784 RepID=A0A1H4HT47_9BURK|nr:hypothetical protein [Paraburkholderia sartisoli]SEB24766.1 hypothetical protein SAMN05192564_11515 [Paraburkholderia sartisoli]
MTTNPVFKSSHGLSALLPSEARMVLARAAQEVRHMKDPLMREVVMEAAIARVRLQYPQFFKE